MVQKEGSLQAIICAGPIAFGGSDQRLTGQMNHPGVRDAPGALAA
jgi:hypothetical protein